MKTSITVDIKQDDNTIYDTILRDTKNTSQININNINLYYDLHVNKDVVSEYYDYTHYKNNTIISRDDLVYIYKDSNTLRYNKNKIIHDKPINDYSGLLARSIKPSDGYFLFPSISSKTNSSSVYRSYPLPVGGISKQSFRLYYKDDSDVLNLITDYSSIDCYIDYLLGVIYINEDTAIKNNIRVLFTTFNTVPVSIKGLGNIDYKSYVSGYYDIVNSIHNKIVTITSIDNSSLHLEFSKDVVIRSTTNNIKIDGEYLTGELYVSSEETIIVEVDTEIDSEYSIKPITIPFNLCRSIDNLINTTYIDSSKTLLGITLEVFEKISNNRYETNPIILNI